MAKSTYLADIDGLRAISVVAVVLFHFFPMLGGAGYLGVDAFFVISGFVISASLLNYPTPDGFQSFLARFYLRRIRRLLPALALVVLVTTLIAVLVVSRSETSLKTGAFAVVGLANIYLYSEALDYFALTSELNPFTHMWSLGVEDQFYLIFPILVWFLGNRAAPLFDAQRLFKPMLAISCISLVSFIILFHTDFAFAFYMMPTRLWQIGLGILAYIAVSRNMLDPLFQRSPLSVPVLGLCIVLAFGLHAILFAHIMVSVFTAYALAIIWHRKSPSAILGSSLVTYVGKISYSLYLWHWPTVVLLKHTFGATPLTASVCLVFTVLIAMGSYHFVEIPFRHRRPLPPEEKLVTHFRVAVALSIGFCVFLLVTFPRFAESRNSVLAKAFGVTSAPEQMMHACHGKQRMATFENPLDSCLGQERSDDKPRRLYLLGDSHGNHLIPMLNKVLAPSEFDLVFANFENRQYGVQSLIRFPGKMPPDYQYVIDNAAPGDILMVSFHRGRLNTNWDEHLALRSRVEINTKTENFVGNLGAVVDQLNKRNVGVLLALDTPLMASITTSETCALQIQLLGESVCEIDKEQDLHTRWRQEFSFTEVKKNHEDVVVWDPIDIIYGEGNTFDVLDDQGDYLMFDWNHVTEKTLNKLQPGFAEVFEKLAANVEPAN